uniref:Mg-protoporphyrin IX chelatase n=1 Tax=Gronococcus sybilensis TaxID=3028029 RepID=A0A9Y1MX06_9RHOD|nr:Mg-protoporyphyrin IX chelatase [Gronococcus sybilensis]
MSSTENKNSKSFTSTNLSFPFTGIIGQEEMKVALLLNVIDPKIGGIIIMGDRGTGKTTTIRAIVDILPEICVVPNDPFNTCPTETEMPDIEPSSNEQDNDRKEGTYKKVPMVDLPLGATEDRVCGTIDIEKALKEGTKAFEPGLLAKANRGLLYVDEVNLLDDHLVDILLDSAASGWNTVEREGVSIRHPAQFVLIGSGNPEEGELRPQLLDRFGMHAEITTVKDPNLRVQIVEERSKFEQDPKEYIKGFQELQENLRKQIVEAQELLPQVRVSHDLKTKISQICSELNIDGLRGDIVINRASKAHASLRGRVDVTQEDIEQVVTLCLRHRLRKDPLETTDSGAKVQQVLKETL